MPGAAAGTTTPGMYRRSGTSGGGGGGGFDVLTLPGLAGWYDASDAASIISSGGNVSQWSDKSGNNRHLTQGVGGRQPGTGTATIGGKNALDFNRANSDVLFSATLTGKPATCSLFAVVNFRDLTNRHSIIGTTTLSDQLCWQKHVNEGRMALSSQASMVIGTSTATWLANTARVYGVTRTDGAGFAFYLDGAADGSGTHAETWSGTDNGCSIGGSEGVSADYMDATIGELIYTTSILSGATITSLCTHLKTKWGTP